MPWGSGRFACARAAQGHMSRCPADQCLMRKEMPEIADELQLCEIQGFLTCARTSSVIRMRRPERTWERRHSATDAFWNRFLARGRGGPRAAVFKTPPRALSASAPRPALPPRRADATPILRRWQVPRGFPSGPTDSTRTGWRSSSASSAYTSSAPNGG